MNPDNSSPQILTPMPNRAAPGTSTVLSEVHVSAHNEPEGASSAGRNGPEMINAMVPRLNATNALDRDLWVAGQTIAASRQERIAMYRALNDANAIQAELERNAAATRKRYNKTKAEYHQLLKHYNSLCEHYRSLEDEHNHVCADLTRALEDQKRLQAITITLEDDKALKESLELELQQSKEELATLEDWKCQELLSRDFTINKLQGDIQTKDAQLARFTENQQSLDQQQNQILTESVESCGVIEIARLEAERGAHEQALNKQQDQIVALSSELESAKVFIQTLQELQHAMEKEHSSALQRLRQENHDIQEVLRVASTNVGAEVNTQTAGEQAENGQESLRNENISLMGQLEAVKMALITRFPGLHDDLDNLESVLAENVEERRSKRRKGTK